MGVRVEWESRVICCFVQRKPVAPGMGTPTQKAGPEDKGGAGSDDSLGQMIIDQIVGFGI